MFNLFGGTAAKPRLTTAEAVAKLAAGEITVIDCREAAELRASGTAAGGLHVPVSLIVMKADPKSPDHDKRIDPAKPVAVFCASGGRSGMATQALERLGYTAFNIGGFGDWCAAGGPVKR